MKLCIYIACMLIFIKINHKLSVQHASVTMDMPVQYISKKYIKTGMSTQYVYKPLYKVLIIRVVHNDELKIT